MTRTLSLVYWLLSALYLISLSFEPLPISWLIKALPIMLLASLVINVATGAERIVLLLAALFSASGDIILELGFFVPGLAAFLIAQLHYAAFFALYHNHYKTRWGLSTFMAGYVVFMAFLLAPNLGDLLLPVMGYLVVIAMMGFLAVQSKLPMRWAVLGALVFVVSDSFIAVNKFVVDIPLNSYWVMITYYAAQWMLITGCLSYQARTTTMPN